MRGTVSAKLINVLMKHDLRPVRRIEAAVLYELAAVSFRMNGGMKKTVIGNPCLTSRDPLESYAGFTVKCMEQNVPDPERLYDEAYRLGQRIRRITGLTKEKDLRRLIEYLYCNINISLRWISSDKLIVRKCFFSRYYTPEQCRIMSNVDSGIIGGILGGGCIVFTERITEGCSRCKARLLKEREQGQP